MIKYSIMKKVVSIVALAFALMLTCVSCQTNTVKIGLIVPESTGLGVSMKAGMKLAEAELNKNSDVKYKVIIGDAATENDVSKTYDRLRSLNHVRIFVTAGTQYSLKLKSNTVGNGDLLLCVASDPAITAEGFWGVYKIGNSSVDESDYIINYLKENASSEKVAVFYPNTTYGLPFKETLCAQLAVCVPTVYEEGAYQQYDGMISKVLAENPGRVIAIGFSPSLGILIKKIRATGFGGEIVSNAGFADSDVMVAAGDAAKDVLYIDYDFERSPKTDERNDLTQRKYKIDFTSICFLAYSIPYLVEAGLRDNLKIKDSSDEDIYGLLNENILHKASDIIRSLNTLKIADEYSYLLLENGDVKPSLILKRYD